jgi:hypothetical protein
MRRVVFTVPLADIAHTEENAAIPRHVQRQTWLDMGQDWQDLSDEDGRHLGRFRKVEDLGDRVRCEAEVERVEDLLPGIRIARQSSQRSGIGRVNIQRLQLFLRPRIENDDPLA